MRLDRNSGFLSGRIARIFEVCQFSSLPVTKGKSGLCFEIYNLWMFSTFHISSQFFWVDQTRLKNWSNLSTNRSLWGITHRGFNCEVLKEKSMVNFMSDLHAIKLKLPQFFQSDSKTVPFFEKWRPVSHNYEVTEWWEFSHQAFATRRLSCLERSRSYVTMVVSKVVGRITRSKHTKVTLEWAFWMVPMKKSCTSIDLFRNTYFFPK
jgi:hypothetical protein